MFTLAISCLTTSNLPSFTDLTFSIPMQYCSLQNRTLLPSPITSTSLMIGDLKTSPCTCWAFVYFLWRNVCLSLPPVFLPDWAFFCLFCFLLLSYLSSLSIWELTPYQIGGLQILSTLCRLSFHFVDCFFCCVETF